MPIELINIQNKKPLYSGFLPRCGDLQKLKEGHHSAEFVTTVIHWQHLLGLRMADCDLNKIRKDITCWLNKVNHVDPRLSSIPICVNIFHTWPKLHIFCRFNNIYTGFRKSCKGLICRFCVVDDPRDDYRRCTILQDINFLVE